MSDPRHIFSIGRPEWLSLYWQRTPVLWWFRIVSFQCGPDHDRRNGWHFYVPFLRLTRAAVKLGRVFP